MADRYRKSSRKWDTWYFSGSPMGGNSANTAETAHCIDEDGPGDCGFLQIQKSRVTSFPRVTGRYKLGWFDIYVPGCIAEGVSVSTGGGHLSVNSPDDSALAAMIASRSNPSRADVSLPTFIGELKDFPQTLRRSKDLDLVSHMGSEYLRYNFGWIPLLSDLKKMMQMESLITNRLNRLQKLSETGELRSTMNLHSDSNSQLVDSAMLLANFSILNVYYAVSKSTTLNVRGHIRWERSQPTMPAPVHWKSRDYARRLVLGINSASSLETAWNLMPWSWLADYFGSVGDYLSATKNAVGANIKACAIMRHTNTTVTIDPSSMPAGVTSTSGSVEIDTKSRRTAMPGISAELPVLTNGQSTILGALMASRSGKLR